MSAATDTMKDENSLVSDTQPRAFVFPADAGIQ
jgi:hypothetical protein